MMKKLQYKTRAYSWRDYVFWTQYTFHVEFPLAQLQCARRRICVVLNKSIKLNILFICFIAHADDLMCVVCLSIDRHSLISKLISFFLLLRFLLFRPSASATANGSEDDRATAYLLCNTSNESDAMQIFHEIGFIFLNTYILLIWGLCSHLVPTSATLFPFPFIHSNGWYTYLN